jgi:acyl-coenzyme A synthetase/AMP-(fatty) acid ligase
MRDILAALARRARSGPAQPAIVHVKAGGAPSVVTAGELAGQVVSIHAALPDAAERAPVVPIFQHRSAGCVALMLAVAAQGRAFSCLNTRLKPVQVMSIMEEAGADTLYVDAAGKRLLERGAPDGLTHRLATVGGDPAGMVDVAEAADRLEALAARIDDTGAACCLFTSGSTGVPKGVLIAAGDLADRAAAEVKAFGIGPSDRLLNVLPFAFDVGLNQLLTTVLSGAALVILDSWMPADLLRTIEQERITGVSGVPAVWRDLKSSGLVFDGAGPHRSLRFVTVSGGSLATPELMAVQELLQGVGIYKTYGQTESFRSTILHPSELAAKPGSVGRAFGGAGVRVLDDTGRLCDAGEVGEVVHSGLGVMMGYLNDNGSPGKRRPNPFRGHAGESEYAIWTGDAGYLDEDGYLYLKGRRDGMLKVSGNRFYADEVAAALASLPGVIDADVVGLDPEAVETRVAGFVVASEPVDVIDLKRSLATRVASYMVPSSILVLPGLPRLANGKTDRVRLRAMALGEAAGQ